MYNRYIPQSDGSYRKKQMPEPTFSAGQPSGLPAGEAPELPPAPSVRPPAAPPPGRPAGSFLRQLLPGGLDTGDLLIGVLLLLMAGDRPDNKNTALLTLALYLFL